MNIELVPGADALPARSRESITGLVVHRIEVSQEDASFADTPSEVARFFREHPIGVAATGGKMPYPLLIDTLGEVTQTVPLGRVTPHARLHNPGTVGVGCLGDFRARPPSPAQRQALVALCAALCAELGLAAEAVVAHDELTGGSADPSKICPGAGLPLAALRADVAWALREEPGSLGLVW